MLKPFWKANRFVLDAFRSYYQFATKSEIAVDLYGALIISLVLVLLSFVTNELTIESLVGKFDALNGAVLNVVSILAGFNVASIAVIASSQSDLVNYLKSKPSKTSSRTSLFSVLLIFFTWAIVVQLVLIFIGVIYYFSTQFFITNETGKNIAPLWLLGLVWIWLGLVLHSILVSIRNIKMLFVFITAKIKDEK